ncbi:hypothetical protein Rctr71_025 [Virus Rctr71]|nr:hypothetical protein Rctr71_025 [Virus Rctr71]
MVRVESFEQESNVSLHLGEYPLFLSLDERVHTFGLLDAVAFHFCAESPVFSFHIACPFVG